MALKAIDLVHALPPPTLEVFYSPTCAPCRLELPVLAEFVNANGMRVRVVVLDHEARARTDIAKVSPVLIKSVVTNVRARPRSALLAAGDADGILPFARSIDADGTTCASWRGGLTRQRVRTLIEGCTRFILRPTR